LLVLVVPSAALGVQLHAFSGSFGAPGAGAGQLALRLTGSPGREARGSGLAVNRETGDVYVADTANNRIDEFSAAGTFVRAFGWAVDATTPEAKLQQCTTVSGCQAGSSGNEPGQLKAPTFLAVDNSCALHKPLPLTGSECQSFDPSAGDLYVAGVGQNLVSAKNIVTKYDSEGNLVGAWGDNGEGFEKAGPANGQLNGANAPKGPFGQPTGLAVDPTGNLWVGVEGTDTAPNAHVYEFAQTGGFEREWGLPELNVVQPQGIAVDSSGGVYVSQLAEEVRKFSAVGKNLGLVYRTHQDHDGQLKPSITAVTLDPATNDLFIDEGAAIQDVFGQCEPNPLGCGPTQTFGSGHLVEAAGLALGPGGTVFAANTGTNQIAVFKTSLEASVQPATEVKATSAVLHATANAKGSEVTTCFFEYGSTDAYGRRLPCLNDSDQEVGTGALPVTGSAPVALHADAAGLKAGVSTHYRLRIGTATGEVLASEDEAFLTLVLPRIEAEEATAIAEAPPGSGEVSATLEANVNPQGLAVGSCQVEWGTSIAYGNTASCEPPAIPAGSVAVPIAVRLSGLQPGTTYHWRVAASDENGAESSPDNTFVFLSGPSTAEVSQECGNQALREANGSAALPDCRAYELVTPPHKNGASVALAGVLATIPPTVSQDGSRLLGASLQCFGAAPSCNAIRVQTGVPYEFTRSPSGWESTALATPAGQFTASTVRLESAESSRQLLSVAQHASPPAPGREWFYARSSDGSLSPIGPVAAEPGDIETFTSYYDQDLAGTADLSHVVYLTEKFSFWPSLDSGTHSLFEYAGEAEHPFLVAVTGGPGSTDLIGTCGVGRPGVLDSDSATLSADGRTVFFIVNSCPTGSGVNAGKSVPVSTLYARIDGESAGARTVKISGPAPEPACDSACQAQAPAAAQFVGSSSDGSMVYFTSTGQLTNEATQGSQNLYLYRDLQEEPGPTGDHLTYVSAGDTSGQGPQMQGVMAVSPDGSHIYFVAKGLLAGANGERAEPEGGADNLYLYDANARTTRFIATLPGKTGAETSQWAQGETVANVTADGRYLLFTSAGRLTPDATRDEGPQQVYRYDAQRETLTRVSIGQRGFHDNGNRGTGGAKIVPASRSVDYSNGRPPLNPSMSVDGSRVFFESPVGLTLGALDDAPINGEGALAENVYEWEQDGTEGCALAAGCVYLISDGHDLAQSALYQSSAVQLIGTDAEGKNVFFSTARPLVPADGDTGRDVYDARVGGGFTPAPTPVSCQGEACQGGPAAASIFAMPGSATLNGLGNLAPPTTPKPKAKPLARARLLAKALKACHTKQSRHKRAACERQARKRYGTPASHAKSKSHKGGK
jgi:Tol biopolymer transport system component